MQVKSQPLALQASNMPKREPLAQSFDLGSSAQMQDAFLNASAPIAMEQRFGGWRNWAAGILAGVTLPFAPVGEVAQNLAQKLDAPQAVTQLAGSIATPKAMANPQNFTFDFGGSTIDLNRLDLEGQNPSLVDLFNRGGNRVPGISIFNNGDLQLTDTWDASRGQVSISGTNLFGGGPRVFAQGGQVVWTDGDGYRFNIDQSTGGRDMGSPTGDLSVDDIRSGRPFSVLTPQGQINVYRVNNADTGEAQIVERYGSVGEYKAKYPHGNYEISYLQFDGQGRPITPTPTPGPEPTPTPGPEPTPTPGPEPTPTPGPEPTPTPGPEPTPTPGPEPTPTPGPEPTPTPTPPPPPPIDIPYIQQGEGVSLANTFEIPTNLISLPVGRTSVWGSAAADIGLGNNIPGVDNDSSARLQLNVAHRLSENQVIFISGGTGASSPIDVAGGDGSVGLGIGYQITGGRRTGTNFQAGPVLYMGTNALQGVVPYDAMIATIDPTTGEVLGTRKVGVAGYDPQFGFTLNAGLGAQVRVPLGRDVSFNAGALFGVQVANDNPLIDAGGTASRFNLGVDTCVGDDFTAGVGVVHNRTGGTFGFGGGETFQDTSARLEVRYQGGVCDRPELRADMGQLRGPQSFVRNDQIQWLLVSQGNPDVGADIDAGRLYSSERLQRLAQTAPNTRLATTMLRREIPGDVQANGEPQNALVSYAQAEVRGIPQTIFFVRQSDPYTVGTGNREAIEGQIVEQQFKPALQALGDAVFNIFDRSRDHGDRAFENLQQLQQVAQAHGYQMFLAPPGTVDPQQLILGANNEADRLTEFNRQNPEVRRTHSFAIATTDFNGRITGFTSNPTEASLPSNPSTNLSLPVVPPVSSEETQPGGRLFDLQQNLFSLPGIFRPRTGATPAEGVLQPDGTVLPSVLPNGTVVQPGDTPLLPDVTIPQPIRPGNGGFEATGTGTDAFDQVTNVRDLIEGTDPQSPQR
ncbi:MAG: hypothetical protein SFZ03_04005 [Candidatus Melainabacteria bacterium]|nr:hypothetical protein [Candidatus Melainabacteria bacterium]